MSKTTHRIIIAIASLVWAGLLLNLVLPFPPPWEKVLRYFAIGLFVIHALELAMFRALLGESGNSKAVDSLLIIIAGAFHASWLAKMRAAKSASQSQTQ